MANFGSTDLEVENAHLVQEVSRLKIELNQKNLIISEIRSGQNMVDHTNLPPITDEQFQACDMAVTSSQMPDCLLPARKYALEASTIIKVDNAVTSSEMGRVLERVGEYLNQGYSKDIVDKTIVRCDNATAGAENLINCLTSSL